MSKAIAYESNIILPDIEEEVVTQIIPETPKLSRGDKIQSYLEQNEAKALHLLNGNKKRFERIKVGFMLALIREQLDSCDYTSIVSAFYTCCQYNLDPSSGFGKVYLIKYENKKLQTDQLQAQIGYLGWMELIMRRKDIVSYVDAKLVYEDDEFDFEISEKSWFKYKPNLDPSDDRKLRLAYAVVKFTNGDIKLEIATLKDIEEARLMSPSAFYKEKDNKLENKYSIWSKHFNSMAKVVVLRRFKSLALSITHHNHSEVFEDREEYNMNEVN